MVSAYERQVILIIERINQEMRAISAELHKCDSGMVLNKRIVREKYNNICRYLQKYNTLLSTFSEMERMLFMGETVPVWNGETVGVFTWQTYLRNSMTYLQNDVLN